jgi:hypothetical protein
MALIIKDRVQETSTTGGAGALQLGGAPANFVTFGSVMANADTTYYAIIDQINSEWEVGLGTYTTGAPPSLVRNTVYASSNAGNLVNFAAGSVKYIYIDALADRLLMKDANNTIPSPTFSGTISGTPSIDSASSLASQVVTVDLGSFSFINTLATATTTGTGTTATITWTVPLAYAPPIGSRVLITGVAPTGYNGTYTVTASTTTSVSFASSTTGAMTVVGNIQTGDWVPVYSQTFSVAISPTLWSAASVVTGTAYGAAQPIVYPGNAGAAINALGDELEMDGLVVAASLGSTPNVNIYVSTVHDGPVVGPRQIALKLF